MKQVQYKVSLTEPEYQLLLYCMMEYRNRMIRQNRPTEDIDDLILKLTGKNKRLFFFYM